MNIEVVIGSNYGDEGKGLVTEYLCRNRPSPIVILSNGGCQRGHTVNNKELSCRHIFHHFGSGTLLGIPTVLSKTFLLNPIVFVEEWNSLPVKPVVFRAPGCLLQLPGDMFTNQMLEINRGENRHGSCGWGIWETILRNENVNKLTFESFAEMPYDQKKGTILRCYEYQKYHELEGLEINELVEDQITSTPFIDHFISDFMFMYQHTIPLKYDDLLQIDWKEYGFNIQTFIVENGQGLGLDEEYTLDKIHTTPSSCGLKGAKLAIGAEVENEKLIGNYVSRSYFTRHGAGPFPEETKDLSYIDYTNIYNPYQGHLRFGKMDAYHFNVMKDRILKDALNYKASDYNIIITHRNVYDYIPYMTPLDQHIKYSFSDDSRHIR
jgi:adenylosuccinate synthase